MMNANSGANGARAAGTGNIEAGNTQGAAAADGSLSKLSFGGVAGPAEGSGEHAMVRKRAKVPQQTIIMLVVLAVSAGAIYGMRKLGMKAGIAMGVDPIEYTAPNRDRTQSYDRIMGDLARIQNPLDVALSEFGKSPFMLHNSSTAVIVDPVAGPSATAEEIALQEAAKRAESRRVELESRLADILLQSVMGGRRPLARINGETYRIGDVVNEVFVIKRIADRSVVLTTDGKDFTLTLELARSGNKSAPMKMGKPSGK